MTFNQYLKDRLKDDPEFTPTYIKKMAPSYKEMRKLFGVGKTKLRGRGWTRKYKDPDQKAKKLRRRRIADD